MDMTYLAIDSDVELAHSEAAVWKATRGIGMERVDNMTEGIKKLLSGKYLYVGINSDAVDCMALLRTMRNVTNTPILIATGNFITDDEVAAMGMGADLYARWHETTEDNIASVLAHVTRIVEQRTAPLPPSNVIVCKNMLLAPFQQSVFVGNHKLDLTAKEFNVKLVLSRVFRIIFIIFSITKIKHKNSIKYSNYNSHHRNIKLYVKKFHQNTFLVEISFIL